MNLKQIVKDGVLVFGAIILLGFALKGNITHEQFDSEMWKNWTETEATMSLRWDMMNSLRNNHELMGKTKDQISVLLGEPERKSNSEFNYYLGMAKRGIDIGNLSIKFDKNRKVTEFSVRHS